MATAARTTTVGTDYRRLAGMFGLVTAALIALLIIFTFAAGAPPALDDPSRQVLNYFQENDSMHKLTGIIGFLILGTAPVWFLGLYSALRGRTTDVGTDEDSWPRLALAAFIVTGAFVGTQGGATLALVLGAKDEFEGAPAVAGALFDLYNALGAAVAIAFGLFLVALGVALARLGTYPKWWSTLLYIGGVASFISFLAPFTESDPLALLALPPLIILAVIAAVTGMAMQRGTPTATTRTATL